MGSFTVFHWLVVLVVVVLLVANGPLERALNLAWRSTAALRQDLWHALRPLPERHVATPVLWLIAAALGLAVLALWSGGPSSTF